MAQATVADPGKRLAHGRVAQTTLLALMVCGANLQMLLTWDQTAGTTADEDPADAITLPLKTAPGSLAANGLSHPRQILRRTTAQSPVRVRTAPRTRPTNAEIPPSLSAERDLVTILESYSRTVVCGPVGI
ncbi:hypothetical protein ACFY40_17865 [Streptomyces sp. NPDC012950]|uniref:hypothetical protein n=1 Tax=Streptomyces sp. NPDC012950 TaxID=3364858 RepID=UPI0036CA6F9F